MSNLIKHHSVVAYYVVALAISWTIWSPLVAIKQRWIDLPIPFALHYIGAFGPMVSALIGTALTTGGAGLSELWSRIIKWRVGLGWFLFSTLSPVALFAVAALIAWIITGKFADLYLLGQANYLPYLGFGVIPVWLATYGFGEEIGWRGFVLPRLQKSMSVSRATLILGTMWAIWHTPAFFYLDTFERIGLMFIPGFLIGVLFGAVLFTWLYNGTGGSVLMIALWHGIFDLLTASLASQGLITILMSVGVVAWGLIITNLDRPYNFHRVIKQTL